MDMSSPNEGPKLLAVNLTIWVFALITLGLRFVSKNVAKSRIWWDDYMSILSGIFAAILTFGGIACVKHGLGRHIEVAGAAGLIYFLKMLFVSQFVYTLAIGFAKLSILLLYWRIFGQASARMRFAIIFLAALTTVWIICIFIVACVSCQPISAFWHLGKGHCLSIKQSYTGFAIPNIVTDFLLIVLPIPEIVGLQMPVIQKFGLIFAFICGGVTMIASILRVNESWIYPETIDVTWDLVDLSIYGNVETCLAAASANLPSMGPLLKFLWHKASVNRSYQQRIYDEYDSAYTDPRSPRPTTAGSKKNAHVRTEGLPSRHVGQDSLDSRNAYRMRDLHPIRKSEDSSHLVSASTAATLA